MCYLSIQRTHSIGGAETANLRLAQGLKSRQLPLDSILLSPYRDSLIKPLIESYIQNGLNISCYNLFSFEVIGLFRYLVSVNNVDGIICHGFWPIVISLMANIVRRTKLPIIYVKHGLSTHTTWWAKYLESLILKRATKLVAVSDAVKTMLIRDYGIISGKIVRIYHGLPTFSIAGRKNAALLNKLHLRPSDILVIMVANLRAIKRHDVALQAVQSLIKNKPEVKLLLVGSGPEASNIRKMAETLGIAQNVMLLGHRSDIEDLLSISDVMLITSDWEGFGISAIEAMATGVPVIATRVGGLPEIIVDGVTGLLVPPADIARLTDALQRLTTDTSQRERFGAAALQRFNQLFREDICIENWIQVLKSLSAGKDVSC